MPLSFCFIPLVVSLHILYLFMFILFIGNLVMGSSAHSNFLGNFSKKTKVLPIHSTFKLPSPIPTWPPGEGFASGTIDLGGLQVCQISSFNQIWATHEGGPENLGATFFEPSPIPQGFFMLGSYSQPNNKPLYGWVLAAKEDTNDPSNLALKEPVDYSLIWSSESLKIKQDGIGYLWLPISPNGYKPLGYVVTNSPEKPSTDKVRCVRDDLTDQCETSTWIWGLDDKVSNPKGFNVFSLIPANRGTKAQSVSVGTFIPQNGESLSPSNFPLACLKNTKSNFTSMPNLNQIKTLFQSYSPWIYFHPDETFLPSSVNWFFTNGALLYKKGDEKNPIPIEPNGSNLPQGGSNDGSYWLDLPIDKGSKEKVKKGDLQNSLAYLHIKPMLGATFTDIATWVFYPFNGNAKAKVEFINISLGKIGEHVGDWEHVTLRISNFNGELMRIYFSEHSSGKWIDSSEIEFVSGNNKPIVYSSLHGHAFYHKQGNFLQGNGGIGIRNDTKKSKLVMDCGEKYSIIGFDDQIIELPWTNYCRKWGPNISYDIDDEIRKIQKILPGKLKTSFEKFIKSLPHEILGEEGPTGPKMKNNWDGDEVSSLGFIQINMSYSRMLKRFIPCILY